MHISRSYEEDVVMLCTTFCKSIAETVYLLKGPQSASKLMEGIEEYKKSKVPKKRQPVRNDMMWKAIFEDLSIDFLRFFFPDADKIFDMEKKVEFLDKEFDQFFPHEEDRTGRVRYVDKLVKVFLKDGAEKWIAIHIEVQNQRGKEEISIRMLRYFFLMKDKHNVSITALAILTSGNKKFKPGPYVEEYLGTKLTYEYNIYKILDQDETALRANPNPFAVVIMVALSAIKNKKIDDLDLKAIKHELSLELSRRNMDGAKQKAIMDFIKYYVNFESKKTMSIFEKELEQLTGRTTTMGTEEFLLQQREIEGIEKGIKTGIKETEARKNHDFVENLIVKLALSDEQAADVAEVSLSFVKKVRKEIASRK